MEICKKLCILVNKLKFFMSSSMEDGLTQTQRRYLGYIIFKNIDNDVFAKDIENEFKISKSSVSGIIKTLINKGLIKIEDDSKDGRYKKIIPTKEAMKLKTYSHNIIKDVESKIIDGISEEEISQFIMTLDKIILNIDKVTKNEY